MPKTTKNLLLSILSVALLSCAACQQAASTGTVAPSATPKARSATPAAPDSQTAFNSRQMAWDLGSNLSLAVLGNARNAPPAAVDAARRQSQQLAMGADLAVPPLPEKATRDDAEDDAPDGAAALQYLLQGPGAKLHQQISEKYGADHAALFEAAVKANTLVLLYTPQGELNQPAAIGFASAATQANLPTHYWQPALDKVKANDDAENVSEAIAKMEDAISDYLAAPQTARAE